MIASSILSTLLGVSVGAPASTFGYYDPYAPFKSALERAEFVDQLAAEISSEATGANVGRAYSKATDLKKALKRGELQYAFVHPLYFAAEGGQDLEPVLVGTRDGENRCYYAIFAAARAKATNLLQLKGRRLAIIKTGPPDERFVFNALLAGEVRDSSFFKRFVPAPDLAGALGTLKFRRADAFMGPDLDYRKRLGIENLRKLARTDATLCTLVAISKKSPPKTKQILVSQLRRASARILAALKVVALDGFTDIPPREIEYLKRAIRAKPSGFARTNPVLAPVSEPHDKQILDGIKQLEADILPGASSLVVQRDDL